MHVIATTLALEVAPVAEIKIRCIEAESCKDSKGARIGLLPLLTQMIE